MTDETRETAKKIDVFIRQNAWFDFDVANYDSRNLVVRGSTDFCYYHELEIHFHGVFFVSAYFRGWKSDTTKPVFIIPEQQEDYQLNYQLEIEQGYDLFIFNIEDSENKIIIAAESISYNMDTVLYYYRKDLGPGMRLADSVTKPN